MRSKKPPALLRNAGLPTWPVLLTCLLVTPTSYGQNDWAITSYSTVLTEDPIEYVLVGIADYDSHYQLAGMALSKQITTTDPRYDTEWEVQLIKHVSGQHHYEANALVAARLYPLPWDAIIDTDLALGLGLSYATDTPEFELANHGKANRLLAYILVELEFHPQHWGPWSWVMRSHHRSGAFGTFSDVHGASNSLGLGIKYRF